MGGLEPFVKTTFRTQGRGASSAYGRTLLVGEEGFQYFKTKRFSYDPVLQGPCNSVCCDLPLPPSHSLWSTLSRTPLCGLALRDSSRSTRPLMDDQDLGSALHGCGLLGVLRNSDKGKFFVKHYTDYGLLANSYHENLICDLGGI